MTVAPQLAPDVAVEGSEGPPVNSGRSPASRRHLLGLLDQILSSASNLVVVVVMARLLDPSDFGRFALGYAATTLALALTRAALGTRLTLAPDGPTALRATGALLGSVLILAPVGALSVLVAALATGGTKSLLLVVVLALATPVVCAQDLVRVGALSSGRPGIAVASDAVWVAALAALLLVSHGISPVLALTAWAGAGVVSLVIACAGLQVAPRWRDGLGEIRRRDAVGHATAVGTVLALAGTLLALAVVAHAIGADSAGSLRGASSAMGPVNVLMAFTALQLTSTLTRRPRAADRRACAVIGLGLVLATLAWGGFLLLLPTHAGKTLFGSSWPGIRGVLPWTTLEYVFLAVANAAALGLRVRHRARDLLSQRVVSSLVTIVAGSTVALLVSHAWPVAAAFAAASGASGIFAWRQLLHSPAVDGRATESPHSQDAAAIGSHLHRPGGVGAHLRRAAAEREAATSPTSPEAGDPDAAEPADGPEHHAPEHHEPPQPALRAWVVP